MKHPIRSETCITLKQLKEFLEGTMDRYESGDFEDTEVWIEHKDGLTSPCVELWTLNLASCGAHSICLKMQRPE